MPDLWANLTCNDAVEGGFRDERHDERDVTDFICSRADIEGRILEHCVDSNEYDRNIGACSLGMSEGNFASEHSYKL
jgi:hypothetical protein